MRSIYDMHNCLKRLKALMDAQWLLHTDLNQGVVCIGINCEKWLFNGGVVYSQTLYSNHWDFWVVCKTQGYV